MWLQSIRDGIVSIYDNRLFRTSLFSTSGDLVEVFSTPNPSPWVRGCEKLNGGIVISSVAETIVDDNYQSDKSSIFVFSSDGDTLY